MLKRQTYLHDDLLAEIAGRLKFGASDIEAKIETIDQVEIKPWTYPPHPMDEIGAVYGMRGFEYKALLNQAMLELPENVLLQEALRKFMIVAKLVCGERLEEVRKQEEFLAIQKSKNESKYDQKVRDRNNRVESLRKSWNSVRDTIHTRWKKLGRSTLNMLEKDNTLASMADRDQAFMHELAALGIVAIEDGKVGYMNMESLFPIVTIEEINHIIGKLDSLDSGGFVKKPTKENIENIVR